MNNSELAAKMLQWEETQKAANNLKAEIEAAVLEIGKTQNVGNVRASYSKGRKSVNYQKAAEAAKVPDVIIGTYTTPKVDWKKVCEFGDVPSDILEQYTGHSKPSVSLKLLA